MAVEPARRVRVVALLALAIGGVITVIALPGGRPHHLTVSERATTTITAAITTTGSPPTAPATSPPTTRPSVTTATTVDPGALPQTTAFPPATGAQFDGEMAALWRGVLSGTVPPALPAFFPASAYLQVKAIYDPQADYANRLMGGFRADLVSARALLGAGASRARLVSVIVPSQYAHWVTPGTCDNRVGYFEVPNSRLVYRDGAGQVRSFGIASMISWRGTWYVVHLGAVTRPSSGGVVDDPEVGPGTAAYSSTC
jgi:hypothetical protein